MLENRNRIATSSQPATPRRAPHLSNTRVCHKSGVIVFFQHRVLYRCIQILYLLQLARCSYTHACSSKIVMHARSSAVAESRHSMSLCVCRDSQQRVAAVFAHAWLASHSIECWTRSTRHFWTTSPVLPDGIAHCVTATTALLPQAAVKTWRVVYCSTAVMPRLCQHSLLFVCVFFGLAQHRARGRT